MYDMKIEMPKQKKFAMIPSLNLGMKANKKLDFSKKVKEAEKEVEKPGVKINFSLNLQKLKNEPLTTFSKNKKIISPNRNKILLPLEKLQMHSL